MAVSEANEVIHGHVAYSFAFNHEPKLNPLTPVPLFKDRSRTLVFSSSRDRTGKRTWIGMLIVDSVAATVESTDQTRMDPSLDPLTKTVSVTQVSEKTRSECPYMIPTGSNPGIE